MEWAKKVLIADDEPDILEIVQYNLVNEGYEVITAKDGNEAIEKARKHQPDLIMLDIMMPGRNGIEVCQYLRTQPEFQDTYIMFLTAMSDESSHVRGLDTGADEYITKPISPKILMSRVNAFFRRSKKERKPVKSGEMVIDPIQFNVTVAGREVILAKKEFELLYLLAMKPGRVFLRNEILRSVWGDDVIVGDRTIDVHIRKIRQKLGVECITTIKGVGYKFELQ